jgi:hypothetical protein
MLFPVQCPMSARIDREWGGSARFHGVGSAQDFAAMLAAERVKWQAVAKAANIRID